jgi:uncharacterized surface protein with fasciclin (FAS1) repeats
MEEIHLMFHNSKTVLAALLATTLSLSAANVTAQMAPTQNIVEVAAGSPNHTTLVAAVKAAGLVDTLSGAGPFTVFAPTNAAFDKLPPGTVDTLLKPENKDQLAKILTYHVVAGNVNAHDLIKLIKKSGGKAELKTVSGGTLTATLNAGKVALTDEKGGTATVTTADLHATNGVIHVIDSTLLPSN